MNVPEWCAVLRYEGLYEVSHRGLVRSLDRVIPHGMGGGIRSIRGKVLTPGVLPVGGHLQVHLWRDGARKPRQVHSLVMEAFVGPCPEGQECLHGPGGPGDNRWPEAIHYGTKRENNLDKHRDGTMHAKLTPELVLICRRRRAGRETWAAIAADYGVCPATVRHAVIGITWSHITIAGLVAS